MKLADCKEFDEVPGLRALASMLCLYFWMTWRTWNLDLSFTSWGQENGLYLPWFFFEPLGWTVHWMSPTLYHALLGFLSLLSLAAALSFQTSQNCQIPQRILCALTLIKCFLYFHSLRQVANYHHMHLALSLLVVLASPRVQWLRVSLAFIYWMAASVKFTPSWLYGEYFNSLPSKLPLLPNSAPFVTLASNLVTALELLAPVAFWSRSLRLRQAAVAALLGFHLYSGFIVGIWYTSLMIPLLICLFADGFAQPLAPPRQMHSKTSAALTLLVMLVGSWSWFIPGDVRFTAEGRYFGLFMFDANHRARAEIEVRQAADSWRFQIQWDWPDRNNGQPCHVKIWHNGSPSAVGPSWFRSSYFSSLSARVLNDPYVYYNWAKRVPPGRVSVQLFSQLDGHPEEVCTVNQDDLGHSVTYQGFWRNSWILLPGPDAPASYRWF